MNLDDIPAGRLCVVGTTTASRCTLATAYSGEGIIYGAAARLDLPNWRKVTATFMNI